MNLLFQNDLLFTHAIQKYGCRFRCLQAIAEFEEQKSLSFDQIMKSYKSLSKDVDIMNVSCLCGTHEHLVIEKAFQDLGQKQKKSRQIGIMDGESPCGWDGKPCVFHYIILHWKTTTQNGHYTLADRNGVEIFDPWSPTKAKMKKIKIMRKLLYKVWRS